MNKAKTAVTTTARLPADLHKAMTEFAKLTGTTVNRLLVDAATRYIGAAVPQVKRQAMERLAKIHSIDKTVAAEARKRSAAFGQAVDALRFDDGVDGVRVALGDEEVARRRASAGDKVKRRRTAIGNE